MNRNVGYLFVAFILTVSVLFVGVLGQPVQARCRGVIKSISVEEAAQLIEDNNNNSDFVILDVRTPSEFESGALENAVNIDFYSETFEEEIAKLDRDTHYLIYCRSGGRSSRMLELVKSLGFSKVYEMRGGINNWMAKGYPVVK
ncbi:MAG: hypothetical protein AMS17_07720 [Spirochaetes bacterium DG_61]|jgi:rhodanese-related sulfurtransferase|nr:MAG: hypothetical protein AMS17_07720 [Spirochaetes bacterium DG_61]